ncbi:hypothetical protein [Embleya sp. NPDC005575]|uniref:hypothetical protein n=1 Tax=Embleya sp. NPDC005575 TaxID=3156892 RepID=UPI0033B3E34E
MRRAWGLGLAAAATALVFAAGVAILAPRQPSAASATPSNEIREDRPWPPASRNGVALADLPAPERERIGRFKNDLAVALREFWDGRVDRVDPAPGDVGTFRVRKREAAFFLFVQAYPVTEAPPALCQEYRPGECALPLPKVVSGTNPVGSGNKPVINILIGRTLVELTVEADAASLSLAEQLWSGRPITNSAEVLRLLNEIDAIPIEPMRVGRTPPPLPTVGSTAGLAR